MNILFIVRVLYFPIPKTTRFINAYLSSSKNSDIMYQSLFISQINTTKCLRVSSAAEYVIFARVESRKADLFTILCYIKYERARFFNVFLIDINA